MSQFQKLMVEINENERSRLKGMLGAHVVGETLLTPGDFISFNKPEEILVSRWYPGFRIADLSGAGADEAVGVLLATSLTTDEALNDFWKLLATPDVAINITTELLPRPGVPVKRGKGYLMSEEKIGRVVAAHMDNYGMGPAVKSAFTHVFTRVMSHLNIVQLGAEERTINVSDGFAIESRELRRFIMIEGMRDMFTEQRLNSSLRRLDQDATPDLIGETIARMLREISRLIPEVKLRLEQLHITRQLVHAYHVNRNSLTASMQANTALQTLANYANFMYDAEGQASIELPVYANDDMREAVNNILAVISSAPSMEPMALSKFVALFGFTPAETSEGLYRGAVAYLPLSQTSRMDVADYYPRKDGCEMSLVPQEYVPMTTLAGELSRTLISPEAMTGVANIVADELAQSVADLGSPPMLYTIGLTKSDLVYLAMGLAEITTMVREPNAPAKLVWGVRVAEKWMMRVQAATPAVAYFDDPAAVIAYKVPAADMCESNRGILPTPMPSRQQHIGLTASYDQVFRGDCKQWLVNTIEEPFQMHLPLRNPAATDGVTELKLKVIPLFSLVNTDGSVPDRVGAHYVAIREPGVDRDLELNLTLIHAYMAGSNVDLADTARSWLIENTHTLVSHPAVVREAVRSVNQAIKDANLDGRRLATQVKSVLMKAYFGTLTGVLARFGKIPATLASDLMKDVPVDGLTVKAKLAVASLPTTLTPGQLLSK